GDLPPLRRGAVPDADRPRDRAPPEGAAVRTDRRPRRDDSRLDSGAGALRRRPSREARLPGPTDRRQRRAGLARGGAAGGVRDAAARRTARSDLVPLARGPDREALHARPRAGLRVPARLPDLCLRKATTVALAVPEGDPPVGPGARGESARRLRAPTGRSPNLMAAWTAAAARAERASAPRARVAARAQPQRRVTGRGLWIAIVAVLLAGVLAMNVTVLRLNMP